MSGCPDCPYRGAVCGSRGPIDAPVVVVGEAPGYQEALEGIPFVGASGKLLNGVIRSAGCAELPIYYTNAMRCRPEPSEEPYTAGIATCRPRLLAEIRAHPRKVVIALGNSAAKALLGDDTPGIQSIRGQYLRMADGTPVVPALHPAAVLRAVAHYRLFARDVKRALALGAGGAIPDPGETIETKLLRAEQVEQLAIQLRATPAGTLVAFDVETSGTNPRTDRVLWLGISLVEHFAALIPAEHITALRPALENRGLRWVGHNTQFDVKFLQAAGLPIPLDHDTMLLHACLDEMPGGHGLKDLANELLGTNDYEAALDEYKKKHRIQSYAEIPEEILLPYLAKDVDYTLRLANILLPQVEAQKDLRHLYYRTLLPATRMLLEVERAGMWMDPERVEVARAKLEREKENWLGTLLEHVEPIWDTDSFRRDTGARVGVRGPSKRDCEHYSYTSAKKTAWMLEILGAPIPEAWRKEKPRSIPLTLVDKMMGEMDKGHPAHKFLKIYRAQRRIADEIKALKHRALDPADADAVYAERDEAQRYMDEWERVHWDRDAHRAWRETRVDVDFSPGSPKQVLWAVKRLGLPVSDTQEKTLQGYAEKIPFVEALFGYRGAAKALSTYVEAISEIAAKEPDGRVHATYKLHGTVTGRLASDKPNMQNIPRDPLLRGMFGAPPGRILVEADLSQAELRTLAHFSGDEFLIGVYEAGRDLHSEMAAAVFGPNYTKEQRTAAKTINFGIAYGLSAHGLSRQLGIELEAAQGMIDGWYARVPKARAYLEACRRAPLAGRVLTTPFGRRRRYGLITDENREAVQREATNYAIQCLKEGTRVWTEDGYRPVEAIVEGDRIRTMGGFHEVRRTWSRSVDAELTTLRVAGCNDVTFTDEHPIWSRREDEEWGWRKPQEMRTGDLVWVPRHDDQSVQEVDGLPLTPELANVIGWYLSEGSLSDVLRGKGGIQFALAHDEAEYAEQLRLDLLSVFDDCRRLPVPAGKARMRESNPSWQYDKHPHQRIVVRANCVPFAKWLHTHFGRTKTKRIPPWMLSADNRFVEAVLAAYCVGDGTTSVEQWCVTTVAEELAYGVQALLNKLGKLVRVTRRPFDYGFPTMSPWVYRLNFGWERRRTQNEVQRYADHFECRVQGVSSAKETTTVYNLHVDEEHHICVPYVTHNSTASDIALHAAIEVQPTLAQFDSFITNIVHDSILVECPDDGAAPPQVARLLVETMRRIPRERIGFRVPMDADAKIGSHWGHMKDWEEEEA